MAIFLISFRIQEDSTYEERYESLVDEIKNEASGSIWDETTSFFIIESNKASQLLCDDLYDHSQIVDSKDVLLVINLSARGYAQRGAQYPNRLSNLMDKR